MTASRVSHSTSSNGWLPSRVKWRLKESPFRLMPTSLALVATTTPPARCEARSGEGPCCFHRALGTGCGKSHLCDSAPKRSSCQAVRPPFSHMLGLLPGDGSVLDGFLDPCHHLALVEGLLGAVALHHDQANLFHALECGEPAPTGQTLPPSPDGGATLGHPRVDDLVF